MRPENRFAQRLQHSSQVIAPSPIKAIIILSESKFSELKAILINAGVTAQILPVSAVNPNYISPLEVSGTYRGNAREKTDAFLASWKINLRQKQENLLAFSFKESEVVALAEDSGFIGADDRVANHTLLFQARLALADRMPPANAFPGVETNPVIQAVGGPRPYFRLLSKIDRDFRRTRQRSLDRNLAQVSCVRVVPLKGNWEPLTIEKTQSATFVTSARPAHETVNIAHFVVPDMPRNKRNHRRNKLTEAQQNKDGSYWLYLSVKAQAIREAVVELDLAPRPTVIRHGLNRKSNPLTGIRRRQRVPAPKIERA